MAPSFRNTVLVILAAAVVYLLGNARVSLWDRDEPRYAQCSRQMFQSGDWVVPRLYDDLRAKKPPLIYWCQAAMMSVLGQTAFAARLPSTLAMIATLTLLAIVLRANVGDEQTFWTILVLSSSLWVILLAKMCLTDSVLLFWIVIAQLCSYALWQGSRSWSIVLVLAVATGLGVLTKGPFVIATVGLTLLMLGVFRLIDRRGATLNATASDAPAKLIGSSTAGKSVLQAAVGVAIVLAIVAPWVLLVNHRAPAYFGLMFKEAAGHLSSNMEGHSGPPGMQLLMIWFTLLPWSLLLPMAIVLGWKHRDEPATRFALAAIIGPWIMTEFLKTKLPHYMLPTFPAIAFLTAGAIVRCLRREQRDMESGPFLFFAGAWAFGVAAVGILPWVAAWKFADAPRAAAIAVTLAATIDAGLVLTFFHVRRPRAALLTMGLGMLVLFSVAYGLYLPRAEFFRLSENTAAVLRQAGATRPGAELMIDYKEPSLAFYQGGTIREHRFLDPKPSFLSPQYAAEWPRWMVMTGDVWAKTSPEARAMLKEIATFRGIAYAEAMRPVEVKIVEKRATESVGR